MSQKHIAGASGLTGAANSVQVAVYGESSTSSPLATIPNGDISRIGTESAYQVDLYACSVASSLGLPKDASPEEKHYTLVWTDGAPSKVVTRELVQGSRGRLELGAQVVRETVVYPSTTVPTRGITAQVISQEKPSHIRREYSKDAFSTIAFTVYEIFFYDAQGRVERREPSATPPNP
jgi:hypothetical protein